MVDFIVKKKKEKITKSSPAMQCSFEINSSYQVFFSITGWRLITIIRAVMYRVIE